MRIKASVMVDTGTSGKINAIKGWRTTIGAGHPAHGLTEAKSFVENNSGHAMTVILTGEQFARFMVQTFSMQGYNGGAFFACYAAEIMPEETSAFDFTRG